jgi:CDP-diacylglycerol--glycerol-3-phosphate 3-phosphatidyltransferase
VTLANAITLFRVAMVPFFCAVIHAYTPEQEWLRWTAVGIYLLAGVSDMVDGYIARHFNQMTKFGQRLDPLADKLIVNLAFVFIAANPAFNDYVPPWFMWFPVVTLLRDAVLVLGALAIVEKLGQREFKPSPVGKATTLLQMSTVLAILLHVPFTNPLIVVTLVFTLMSFAGYVYAGIQYARSGKIA